MKTTLEQEDVEAIVNGIVEKLKYLLSTRKEEEMIFDKKSLSQYLKVPVSWIDKHLHVLPHFKLGKYVHFKKSAIDKHVLR